MNKNDILEYLQTFFLTIFIIVIVISGVVAFTEMKTDKPPSNEKIIEYKDNQVNLLIDHYKYIQKSEPLNYVWNVKLGLIYESIGKLDLAEEEYRAAVKRVPYGNYDPVFLLAQLYVIQGKLDAALRLVAQIKEYPDENLIASKASFYALVGDAYFKKGLYDKAITQYKNSLYYKAKTSKYKGVNVIPKLSDSYIELSKMYLSKGDVNKAIEILKSGQKVANTTNILYRLGLIYTVVDPNQALIIFQKVEISDPMVIDYDVYSKLLLGLAQEAKTNMDLDKAQTYDEKLRLVQRFKETSIIMPNDFKIEDVKLEYKKHFIKSKEYIDLTFVIRNNTAIDVSKLYLQIKVYNNNKLVDNMENKIATPQSIIQTGRVSHPIHLKLRVHEKDETLVSEDMIIKLYIKKNDRLKRVPLGEIVIAKNSK